METTRLLVLNGSGDVTPSEALSDLLSAVASEWRISYRKLKSPRRGSLSVCEARDEASRRMYEAGYTFRDIGAFLGGRSHAAIWLGVQRARRSEAAL